MKICGRAIVTKYLPATDLRGARIGVKVADLPGRVYGYPHDATDAHAQCAEEYHAELVSLYGQSWAGELHGAQLDPARYVFVIVK